MKDKIRSNYHWVIAAVVLIEMLVWGGIGNNINGLFVIPVTESLGISRGSYSLVMSLNSLMGFVSTMLSGILFMHFGYKKLVMGGLAVAGLALCFLFGSSKNLATLGFGVAIYGLCGGFCSTAGMTKIIGDWFHKKRGLVLGLVSSATGFGGSLFCILLTNVTQSHGWRMAYRTAGICALVTAVLLLLTIKNRPDDMKLRPYGEGQLPTKKRHRGGHSEDNWPGFSLQELVRKPTFYMMMALTLLSCRSMYMAFYIVVPHMQDRGLTAEQAATVQSVMLLGLSVAKILSGWLCDIIGPKWVTALCMIFGIVGMWLMADVTEMTAALIIISIYTVSLPLTTITVPLLTTELFGYRAHDTAVGLLLSMVSVGGMIASPVINLMYDAMGSYRPGLKVAAILGVVVLVLYEVLYFLAKRDKRVTQAEREAEKALKRDQQQMTL